jgi:aminoglycoside phosphotransferase (APT) family kinase protein
MTQVMAALPPEMDEAGVARLARRLETALPGAGPVVLEGFERIFGGASRQTFRFDACRGEAVHGLILRKDPAASLIDTERKLEFAAYRSFAGSSVPVPAAVLLEEDAGVLGSPFFVMGRIPVGAAGTPFQADCYGAEAPALARQFFSHLGAIARPDPAGLPLAEVTSVPQPQDAWRVALELWEQVLKDDAAEPQPIAAAAIRALRRYPPPAPARLSVVHGDYRSGNFLHDGAGTITAILDWEMAHIGDAHEDLAWALDPMWSHDPAMPLLGIGREEAIALWEAASGLAFDPQSYRWWSLFVAVKGLAIWTSAGRAFSTGANPDLVNAWSAWYCTQMHERQIAARLLEDAA